MQSFFHDLRGFRVKYNSQYELQFSSMIGKGATCQVWSAYLKERDQRITQKLACKIVPLDASEDNSLNIKHRQYIQHFLEREIEAHEDIIKYPQSNIIKVYKVIPLPQKRCLIFVMQRAKCNLYQWILYKSERNYAVLSLDERTARCIFRQLLSAISHLQRVLGIAHRDIKMDNVLVESVKTLPDNHTHVKVRLGDLGFCTKGESYPINEECNVWYKLCQSQCGTEEYCSPEVFSGDSYNPYKSDIFSLGIILFKMASGVFPFNVKLKDKSNLQQYCLTAEAHAKATDFSDDLKDLLTEMLQPNHALRCSLKDIQQHKWTNSSICTFEE